MGGKKRSKGQEEREKKRGKRSCLGDPGWRRGINHQNTWQENGGGAAAAIKQT